jgi:hypothetical protein
MQPFPTADGLSPAQQAASIHSPAVEAPLRDSEGFLKDSPVPARQ